jgi:hypothetical protein
LLSSSEIECKCKAKKRTVKNKFEKSLKSRSNPPKKEGILEFPQVPPSRDPAMMEKGYIISSLPGRVREGLC